MINQIPSDIPEYNLPIYAQINIKRVPITELPDGFTHVSTTSIDGIVKYQTITDGKMFYGCLGKDGKIAFDLSTTPILVLGFERPSLSELSTYMASLCFDDEQYDNSVHYDDSPSGITLNKQLPPNIRLHGVVFKNLNTSVEVIVKTNLRDTFADMDVPSSHIDRICYDAKVVRGWYIDRIDQSLPLLPNNKAKNNYLKYNLINGHAVVDMALPRDTITTITGVRRSNFTKMLKDSAFAVNGWHAELKGL